MTPNLQFVLSIVDSLPMEADSARYPAPCLVGAMLSPADRILADQEDSETQDAYADAVKPSASQVPAMVALCKQFGGSTLDFLQELHDNTIRADGTPEARRAALKHALTLDLQ